MSDTTPCPQLSTAPAVPAERDQPDDRPPRPTRSPTRLPINTIGAHGRIDRAIIAHALYHAGLTASSYSRADAGELWHEFALDSLGLQLFYGNVTDFPRLSNTHPALAVVHRCRRPSQLLFLAAALLHGQRIGPAAKEIEARCMQLLTRAIELEAADTT